MKMTREEFETMDFETLMCILVNNLDEVHDEEMIKEYITVCVLENRLYLAEHILASMLKDNDYGKSEWWLYDISCGTLNTPCCVTCKEHIEHLIDFIN